jgi:hypothetical protein
VGSLSPCDLPANERFTDVGEVRSPIPGAIRSGSNSIMVDELSAGK